MRSTCYIYDIHMNLRFVHCHIDENSATKTIEEIEEVSMQTNTNDIRAICRNMNHKFSILICFSFFFLFLDLPLPPTHLYPICAQPHPALDFSLQLFSSSSTSIVTYTVHSKIEFDLKNYPYHISKIVGSFRTFRIRVWSTLH